jgi:hypothetical protein
MTSTSSGSSRDVASGVCICVEERQCRCADGSCKQQIQPTRRSTHVQGQQRDIIAGAGYVDAVCAGIEEQVLGGNSCKSAWSAARECRRLAHTTNHPRSAHAGSPMNSSELKSVEYKVPPAESYDGGGVRLGVTRPLPEMRARVNRSPQQQMRGTLPFVRRATNHRKRSAHRLTGVPIQPPSGAAASGRNRRAAGPSRCPWAAR